MAFSWFKKKKDEDDKPSYDPTNTSVAQLVKGAFVDYDLKTWEVRAAYQYDWGDNFYADEFQLATADETIYVYVEEGDEGIECTVSQKLNIHALEGNIPDFIIQNESPPTQVKFQGETYYRDEESIGRYKDVEENRWQEMISWTYYDMNEEKVLSIERWGEEDFAASLGKVVQEFEFSSFIMP